MTSPEPTDVTRTWKDIAVALLSLGATSYGGPAILGIMQAELQEKRQWVSKERFVEGLAIVVLLVWPIGVFRLLIAGSVLGILRVRLFTLPVRP